jgi:quinol monooxygenase YgiN
MSKSHRANTFAVIGVYPDGEVRHHHVTTENVEAYAEALMSGVLPFAQVFTIPCENMFTCDHSSVVPA